MTGLGAEEAMLMKDRIDVIFLQLHVSESAATVAAT